MKLVTLMSLLRSGYQIRFKRAVRLSRFFILQQELIVHYYILSENIKGAYTDQSATAKSWSVHHGIV